MALDTGCSVSACQDQSHTSVRLPACGYDIDRNNNMRSRSRSDAPDCTSTKQPLQEKAHFS